jgi:hypothetical protein
MALLMDTEFSWDVGENTALFYYLVQGKCLNDTSADGTSGATCEVAGFDSHDAACGGMGQTYMTTIGATSLSDLCVKLNETFLNVPMPWPIISIKKFSRPVYLTDIREEEAEGIDHSCNELIEQDFSQVAECLEFAAELVETNMGMTTSLISFDYGGIAIGSGGVVVGGTVDFPEKDYSVVTNMGMTTSLMSLEIIFNGENQNNLTDDSDEVINVEGSSKYVKFTRLFVMKHNLYQNNNLSYFLSRNGFSLSDEVGFRYNDVDDLWRYSAVFDGTSEKWNVLFEWGATDEISVIDAGPLVWKFSMWVSKVDASNDRTSTRLLLYLVAPNPLNPIIDFDFDFNVVNQAVDSDLEYLDGHTVLVDKTGLFKNEYWADNPLLRIRLPIGNDETETNQFDVSPSYPD